MMKHFIYINVFLIFLHGVSSEIISEHQVDPRRFQEGRTQYELIKQRAELPAYGQCWLNTLSSIHLGCKNVTDLVQSRLSLSYLNCFLEAQQRHHYPCTLNESIPTCTRNMTEGDRASLATFFVHTQNICYFLEIKYWNQHTQKTIQRLSDTSEDVVSQLELSSSLQKDMLIRQNITLKNQESILAQAINLSQIISSSSSNMQETLNEFRMMSHEQMNSMNDVFERIAKLQSMFLGEISGLYSIVFYSMSILICFLFTSAERTASARLALFVLMSVNFLIEKVIIYYKTIEVADPILGAHNDTKLYESLWICRKIHYLIGFFFLVYTYWHYTDINAENNFILKQIQVLLNKISKLPAILPDVEPSPTEQPKQEEADILSAASSTGYESDSSVGSISSYANESSDATYIFGASDSVSTISSRSNLSLQQELLELDEEAAEYEANRFSFPSTSRAHQIYTSSPLQRTPVHSVPRANHEYNLRSRTPNTNLNDSVKSESTADFFNLIKGKSDKEKRTSMNATQNPEMSDNE